MDVQAAKLNIINRVLAVDDERLLAYVQQLLITGIKAPDDLPPTDFWDRLTDKQKADLLESIHQVETGEIVPNAAVMAEFKSKYVKS